MNEEEARLLAIRAADGELTDRERRSLQAYLREHPQLGGFLEEETRAAADADRLGAGLRLAEPGLEEAVLRSMGLKPRASRRRRLLVVGGLAAAIAAILLVRLASPDKERPRSPERTEAAVFDPEEGHAPVGVDDGVYRLAQGVGMVEVRRPTLVETPAGVLQLAPGRYRIRVRSESLTLTVFEGAAVYEHGESRKEVKSGETAEFVRPEPPGVVVETTPPPVAVTGPGCSVAGRVLGSDGRPLEGASLWASVGADRSQCDVLARTDESGRFRLDGIGGAARWIGATAPRHAPSDLRRIEPQVRTVYEMDLVLRHRGGAIAVSVQTETGAAIPGASVQIGGGYWRNFPVAARSPEGYLLAAAPPRMLTTNGAGTATAEGLPPDWNSLHVRVDGHAPFESWVRLVAEGTLEHTVVLRQGSVVTGFVRDADGEPVVGACITFRQAGSGRTYAQVGARSGAEGEFGVESAPVGKVEIVARDRDGHEASAWLTTKVGGEQRWDAVLHAPGSLHGHVVYADDGEPVVRARVSCRRAYRGRGTGLSDTWTDEQGAFAFEQRPDVLHEISVWYPNRDKKHMIPPARRLRGMPDESPLEFALPRRDSEPEPGFLAGLVVLPGGGAAAETRVTAWPAGQRGWNQRTLTKEDGTFRIGPLEPGFFELEIHRDGQPTLHLERIEIESGQVRDLGALEFPRPGRIRARILGPDGRPLQKTYVVVQSLDQSVYFSVTQMEGGIGLSEELAPGRYLVLGGAPGMITEVEVRAGQTTEIEILLRGGRKVEFVFQRADGSAPRELAYRIHDSNGRSVNYGFLDHGEGTLESWLVSGVYRITCSDERGREASVDLTVSEAKGEQRVIVTLR